MNGRDHRGKRREEERENSKESPSLPPRMGDPPRCLSQRPYLIRPFASAVFGLALCSQFDVAIRAAPILVERCTRALEERAFADTTLDLYKIYHSSPPNEQILELRQKLNEGETERRSLARPTGRRRLAGRIARAHAINSRQSFHNVRLAFLAKMSSRATRCTRAYTPCTLSKMSRRE